VPPSTSKRPEAAAAGHPTSDLSDSPA